MNFMFITENRDKYQYGEGNGTPLQYSCLENPMDGGAWKAAVHGVAKGRTRLSDFTFTFHFHALEKEMATHSSVLALSYFHTSREFSCGITFGNHYDLQICIHRPSYISM